MSGARCIFTDAESRKNRLPQAGVLASRPAMDRAPPQALLVLDDTLAPSDTALALRYALQWPAG